MFLVIAASAAPWSRFGGESPDPVTIGDTSWTWDVEFEPSSQPIYARTSLNLLAGSGSVGSGIVAYRTRNSDGTDSPYLVGQSDPDGLANFAYGTNIDSVTFGWLIASQDNAAFKARINMEIWGAV